MFDEPIISKDMPKEAIRKGRNVNEVMAAWAEIFDGAEKRIKEIGGTDEDLLAATTYRIYLLGVEDVMKE